MTISALDGEWNIIEINGAAVASSAFNSDYPYIFFDSSAGRISGNSGCNRIMSSFETNGKPGELELGTIASTYMLCPDMTLEENVLNALKKVKGYKKMETGKNIALVNSRKRPVLILSPREGNALVNSLQGEWKITQVKEEAIPEDMNKQPFISFDMSAKRIHGTAGCNIFNGNLITEANFPRAINFPATATTRMMCPDMDIESKVLDALNNVKAFDILSEVKAALCDNNGVQLLLLEKKQ